MTPTVVNAPGLGSALASLVRIETIRYLKHPLFWVGSTLLLLSVVPMMSNASTDGSPLSAPIAPAFLMGVFGLVVSAQLTRSAHKVGAATGVPPVSERVRTFAIAISFVVPVLTTALWLVVFLVVYTAQPPPDGVWWFDTLPAGQPLAVLVSSALVAAFGGPMLGLVVARWSRWRAAPLLVALGLVVSCMLTQGDVEALRRVRLLMPWTAWSGGVTDGETVFYPGSPGWWLVYVVALSGLALVAAVYHDPDADRRRYRRVAVGIALVGALAVTLAMTTGNQHTLHATVGGPSAS